MGRSLLDLFGAMLRAAETQVRADQEESDRAPGHTCGLQIQIIYAERATKDKEDQTADYFVNAEIIVYQDEHD